MFPCALVLSILVPLCAQDEGLTALMRACEVGGTTAVVRALLDHGADMNKADVSVITWGDLLCGCVSEQRYARFGLRM